MTRRAAATKILATLGLTLVFLAAASAGFILHLNLPRGRRVVANVAVRALRQELQGGFAFDAVEHVGRDRVEVRGFHVADPRGREVLTVSHVTVRADMASALRAVLFGAGSVAFTLDDVDIERVETHLYDDTGAGVPSLAEAFTPRKLAPGAQSTSARVQVRIGVRTIELARGYARGSVSGLPTLELEVNQVRAFALITQEGVELGVARFGAAARGLGGADARGVGSLRLKAPGWLWGSFDGFFGDLQVGSVVRVDGRDVIATIELPKATPDVMRGIIPGYPLQRDASVHIDAAGRFPQLLLTARLEVDGARVLAKGPVRFEREPSFDLQVAANHLNLAALAPRFPASDLDANFQLKLRTPNGKPLLSLDGSSDAGSVGGIDVPAATLQAQLATGVLSGEAWLKEPGLPIHATFHTQDGKFDLRADSEQGDLDRAPRLKHAFSARGQGSVHLKAHVEQGKLSASVEGSVRNFQHGDLELGKGTITGRASGSVSDLRNLNLDLSLKGERARSGALNFPTISANAKGRLAATDVSAALTDPRGGTLETHARVEALEHGTQLRDVKVSYRKDEAELSGGLDSVLINGDKLTLRNLALRGLGGELTGSVEIGPTLIAIDARGKRLNLGALSRLLGIPSHYAAGKLDLDADVLLARDIERGSVHATLLEGEVGPLSEVSSSFNATLENHHLVGDLSADVHGVLSSSTRFDLELSGSVRDLHALKDTVGEAEFDIRDVNLNLLSLALAPGGKPPVAGKLAVTVKATRRVPYALPSYEVTGFTDGLSLEAGLVHPLAPALHDIDARFGLNLSGESGDADVSVQLVDRRGVLSSASLATTVDWVEALRNPSRIGTQLLEAPVLGKLLIDERPLSELPRGLLPVEADGRLRLEVALSGTLSAPELSGRLRLATFELSAVRNDHPLDFCAQFGWAQSSRKLGSSGEFFLSKKDLAVCQGRRVGQYSLNGSFDAKSPDGVVRPTGSAVLLVESLPLDAIPGFGQAELGGTVSGRVSLSELGLFPALSANLTLNDARIRSVAVGEGKLDIRSNEQALGVTLDLAKGQGKLGLTLLAGLDLGGPFPRLKAGEPIGVRVLARQADAVILSPFVRDLFSELGGKVDADLSASLVLDGSAAAQHDSSFQGKLALHEGVLELAGLGLKLDDVELSADATRDGADTRVSVPALTARAGERGRVVAVRNARLWLQGLRLSRAEGSVDAAELPLSFEGVPQATATTRQSISFSVKREPTQMLARINVPYLVIALPQAAARNLISLEENRSIEIVQPITAPGHSGSEGLPWRFEFDLGENVKLTRSDLDLPLSGHTQVQLGDKVDVTGDVELKPGGRIDVSGKTFVIESGEVHFDTGDPGSPRLRVTANWRAADGSVVTADVAGTLKQATLSLSSPGRDLQQIYALLLGGSGSAEGGDARIAGASVGADQVLGPLLENTPLRNVEIRTGSEQAADQRTYSTYTAAVPLSEQVWFEGSYKALNSQVSNEQSNAFSGTLDWRFRRNWSLRTEVGTIGTGVDLLWNYRY